MPKNLADQLWIINRWKRYEERKALMKAQLQRIAAVKGLSGDVSEIVNNALR